MWIFPSYAKYLSHVAQGMLGMLIAKSKAHGGMPYAVFTKQFDSLVQPIIDYGASIWRHKIKASKQSKTSNPLFFRSG